MEDYARYPEFITIREIEVNGRILVTTLLDPMFVSGCALGALYEMRWNIEVDFRTIKATLEMDYSVANRSRWWTRRLRFISWPTTWCAGRWRHCSPTYCHGVLSFTGAKRLLGAFADQLRRTSGEQVRTMIATVTASITTLRLPHRPERIEPRAKKRRPKNLPLLTVPRQVARDLIYAQ